MRNILSLLLLLIPLALTSQEKVFMPYPEVINMHPDYQYSLARLFRTYVVQEGRYELILPPQPEGYAPPATSEVARAQAIEYGAKYYLLSEMNQISDVVIVSFTMYSVDGGTRVWGDMMKALTPDDLDPILSRMAKNLGTQSQASKKADIYNVTGYDAMELRQYRSKYNFGVSIGGALPINTAVDQPFGAGLGFMFSYDSRNLIFDINGEWYWSEADVYDISLDLLWPMTSGPATPYLQGGIGMGGISVLRTAKDPYWGGEYEYDESHGGLMFFLGAGYILNRTSDVHLRMGGKAFIPAFQVDNRFMPGLMINATILFGRR